MLAVELLVSILRLIPVELRRGRRKQHGSKPCSTARVAERWILFQQKVNKDTERELAAKRFVFPSSAGRYGFDAAQQKVSGDEIDDPRNS
jgi:hypothetical protein